MKLTTDCSKFSTQEELDKHLVTQVYDIREPDVQIPLDAGQPPELQFQLEPVTRGGGGGSRQQSLWG